MIKKRYEWRVPMDDHEYTLNLCLTDFVGAEVMDIEDSDGRPVKGVFIPIALNNLFVPNKSKKVWANLNMLRSHNVPFPRTHRIVANWPIEHTEKLRKLGYGLFTVKLGVAYRINKNSDPKMNAKQSYER